MAQKVYVTKGKLDVLAQTIARKSNETAPLTIAEMTSNVNDYLLRPDGDLRITEDGDYLVSQYESVSVRVYGGLPSQYRVVTEIVGPTGAYIDTGIQPNQTTSAVFKVKPLAVTSDVLLGTKSNSDNADWRVFNYSSKIYWDCYSARVNGSDFAVNVIRELKIENNKVTDVPSDTVLLSGTTVANFAVPYNIYINGGSGTSTSTANAKWYYVQIYQGETKVRDYVPCYRVSDNEVGMYDLVTKEFYTSAGNVSFTLDEESTEDSIEQTKTVTPTESEQTVTADAGHQLSAVVVEGIDSKYVGSGVPRNTSEDIASDGTVNLLGGTPIAVFNAYVSAAGVVTASANDRTVVVEVAPNASYSYTWNRVTQSGNDDSVISAFSTMPSVGQGGRKVGTTLQNNPGTTAFSTGVGEKYLAIKIAYVGRSDYEATLAASTLYATSANVLCVPWGYFASPVARENAGTTDEWVVLTSENLHDSADDVANTYISGITETSYNGWSSTDYIPVKANTIYLIKNHPGGQYNALYKSDKTGAVSGLGVPSNSNNGYSFIKTTSDTAYIRMSAATANVKNIEIYETAIQMPTGNLSITANGNYTVSQYESVSVAVPTGGGSTLQSKTVSPTTSQQTVTPDTGYDGLSSVTVNAMPSGTAGTPTATKGTVSNHSVSVTPSVTNTAGYITGGTVNGTAVTVSASELVSGSETKTANGAYDVTNLSELVVDVPPTTPTLQSKTATPTESQQTITADSGYDGLSSVTVNAVSSTYVGSGITRRSGTDLTASGATVTVPAGYYSAQASKAVASGSAGTPSASKGTVSNHSVTVTPSVTNTTGYITGGTKTGTAVTVSASELVSGSQTISANGTTDVTNLASVTVAIPFVTYYTGTTDPPSSLGSDGDIYLKVVS